MDRWIKPLWLLAWVLLIAKLLLMSAPSVPGALSFTGADKLVHALLFGGLVFFLMETVEAWASWRYAWLLAFSLSFSLVYAELLEYGQAFVPGRTVSAADTWAALAGAALASALIYRLDYSEWRKPKLLLQVCCIGCGAYVVELLKKRFRVTLYFYNPNIWPEAEYHTRLKETRRIARRLGLKLLVAKYRHDRWLELVRGHEHEPERGGRCVICYRDRLEAAARLARTLDYQYFASTLSISPHKSAAVLSRLGRELSERHRVKFLDQDFKKQDGFKKSVTLSNELGVYRQDYCGCEFSWRDRQGRLSTDLPKVSC